MSTLNVGQMAARLGLDPSDFLDKMKGVQGVNGFVTGEMARQWKQTAREGTESFRLIDEALGIHLSRPLTKILTQEFPAFASGLQSVLGAGVVGALGVGIFEAFEKVSRSIEHAQKVEEEFAASTRNVGNVFTAAMQSFEKAETLRSLTGLDKKIFEIDSSSIEDGRKKIDALSMAMEKVAKDAAEAHKWTTELLAGVGNAAHVIFNSQSTLGMEEIGKHFSEFQRRFDQLSNLDLLHGSHDSAKFVADEIAKAEKSLTAMTALKITSLQEFEGRAATFAPQLGLPPQVGFTKAEIDAQQQFLDNLQKIQQVLTASAKDEKGAENEARKADAAERQLKAQEAIAALYKEMGSSLAKLQPETDPIKKLDAEIGEFRRTAEVEFAEIGRSAASALATRAALAGLDSYGKKLDDLKIKLEGDILAKQALELLGQKGTFPAAPTSASTPFSISTAPVIPTLGAGGLAGAQFDTFAKDRAAQLSMAAQAYADAQTPQEKYRVGEQKLDLLLQEGLINTNAYTAALAQLVDLRSRSTAKQGLAGEIDDLNPGGAKMQELRQRMDAVRAMQSSGVGLDGTKLDAGDLTAVKLEMQAIEEEENKILLKTGDVNAGFRAWGIEIQKVASAGEVTFEALGQASKGFEDAATNSLMAIMTAQRGQHQKLINELDKMWSQYFDGLAKMAMKRGMDQLLAPLGKTITAGLGGTPGAPALPPTAPGSSTGLGAFFPKPSAGVSAAGKDVVSSLTGKGVSGAAGGASLTSAGTMLQSAATALLSAATVLRASGAGGLGSSGPFSSAGGGADPVPFIPMFAEGGDATPGSSFISGEAGAEKVDLDRSGGAHITPLGFSTKGSGDTHQYFDQRGSILTDDVMRRSEGAAMIHASQKQMMGAMPAMQREISLRKRGS